MPKGIVINPYTRTVTECEAGKDGTVGLEGLNAVLKTDPQYSGLFQAIDLGARHTLWIDDEGCLTAGRPVFRFGNGNAPLAGVSVIFDSTPDGDSVGTSLRVADVEPHIVWTDLETTGDFEDSKSTTGPEGFVFIGGAAILRQREEPAA